MQVWWPGAFVQLSFELSEAVQFDWSEEVLVVNWVSITSADAVGGGITLRRLKNRRKLPIGSYTLETVEGRVSRE